MDRIERAVGKQLQTALESHSFDLRPTWNAFVRKTAHGADVFLIVNQGTAMGRFFEMKCYPAIRHDRIEVPWNTFGFVWGDEAQLQTKTLTFTHPRGNLPAMKVTPATQAADIQSVAGEMLRVFLEQAMPFFQRFSSLAAVEEFVNRVPLAELYPYNAGGPLDHLAARSLLLAKAINPNRYQTVLDACIASTQKTLWPRERYLQTIDRVDSLIV
jgi:hypothetical protein